MIYLHMREFNGTTFGMPVEASSPAFRRMKRNVFTKKITLHGGWVKRTVRCVRADDVVAVMGPAGWLVSEAKEMETIQWGSDNNEYYIIYEEKDDGTGKRRQGIPGVLGL